MYVNHKLYARPVRTMHHQVLFHKRIGGAENDRFRNCSVTQPNAVRGCNQRRPEIQCR